MVRQVKLKAKTSSESKNENENEIKKITDELLEKVTCFTITRILQGSIRIPLDT